jgi:hypothetical protein
MSDTTNEADGIGAADPITGVAGGGDDLAADAQLPDDEDTDYAAGDPEAIRAEADTLVTNDAVAGETVLPGTGDGNDGPTGGAPGEGTPYEPRNELQGDDIDLDDQDEDAS